MENKKTLRGSISQLRRPKLPLRLPLIGHAERMWTKVGGNRIPGMSQFEGFLVFFVCMVFGRELW